MTLTEGSPINGAARFQVELAPHVRQLAPMRKVVSERLLTHDVAASDVDDVLLILSELCTNAIQATATGGDRVVARVQLSPTSLTVEVENVGPPFESEVATARHGPDRVRGRGLDIVRALAGDVTMMYEDGRSTVRVVMPLG